MLTRAQSQPLETSAAWFTVTLSPSESQQYLLKEDGKQSLPPCVEYLSEPASEVASPLLAHKASWQLPRIGGSRPAVISAPHATTRTCL